MQPSSARSKLAASFVAGGLSAVGRAGAPIADWLGRDEEPAQDGFLRQGSRRSRHSSEQRLDHFAADVGEALVTALVLVSQLRVVDSQTMQDRGLQVVDVDRVFNNVIAIIIRLAEGDAFLDATARHPDA